MRKSIKIATAVAAAGLAFAGASAFTASNTQPSTSTVGYGTTTVSGATVNSLTYNLDAPGANVTSVAMVLNGDTHTSNVKMNFNGGTAFACTVGTVTTSPVTTPYTCTPGSPESTSALTATSVVVN